ncbi:sugar phosphate isomerase/epimerase family protein [Aquibacillus sediminis]|uniref:sugar phosphate isomerase/epimerase family protein n=1 Tax=Aquibacillus sediminis TaxID=2574734 RepID=UPI001108CE67|nr:sugar phosphate isomerase/epimerase [Aquibacillus sediminis]
MDKVIIPLNAFPVDQVRTDGQASFVKSIARSGAYGIEIRRELFPKGELPLKETKEEIDKYKLHTVFSVPMELWSKNGTLNKTVLKQIFEEAVILGASWVKVSLGHFHRQNSDILELGELLDCYSNIQLLVENDQTMYGGNVDNLTNFFDCVNQYAISVHMTFDTGNWYYTNQDVEYALTNLAEYVRYLHFKHVVKIEDQLVTVSLPKLQEAEWRQISRRVSSDVMKALEFPIELDELQTYIELVDQD